MMLSRTRHLAPTDLDRTLLRTKHRQTGYHTRQNLVKFKALGTCRRGGRFGECRAQRRSCPCSTKRKTALRSALFGPNRTSDGMNAIEKARSNACGCLTNNRGEAERDRNVNHSAGNLWRLWLPVARRPSPVARRPSPVARRPSPVIFALSLGGERQAPQSTDADLPKPP